MFLMQKMWINCIFKNSLSQIRNFYLEKGCLIVNILKKIMQIIYLTFVSLQRRWFSVAPGKRVLELFVCLCKLGNSQFRQFSKSQKHSFNLKYDIDIYEKTIELSQHSIRMWMDVFSWTNIYVLTWLLNKHRNLTLVANY